MGLHSGKSEFKLDCLSLIFKIKFEWKLTCPLIILLNMVLLSRSLISRSRKVNLLVLTWKWSLVNRTPEILKQSYHTSIQIQCTSIANWKHNISILHIDQRTSYKPIPTLHGNIFTLFGLRAPFKSTKYTSILKHKPMQIEHKS